MADKLFNDGHNRTKRFVQDCKALQDKARKNQLDANQVNQFRNQMDEFFINNDRGTLRHYGDPDHDLHDRFLWRLAKAAVALYEHLQLTRPSTQNSHFNMSPQEPQETSYSELEKLEKKFEDYTVSLANHKQSNYAYNEGRIKDNELSNFWSEMQTASADTVKNFLNSVNKKIFQEAFRELLLKRNEMYDYLLKIGVPEERLRVLTAGFERDGPNLKKLLKTWKDMYNMRNNDGEKKYAKQIVQRILQDENGSELQEAIRKQVQGGEDWSSGYNGIDIFRKVWNASFCLSREEQEKIYPLLKSKMTKETFDLLDVAVRPL